MRPASWHRTPLDERLLGRRTITERDCWEWTGYRNGYGYGQVKWREAGGTAMPVHRLAWLVWRGDPGELCVLHACDNPPCFNPEHLFLGTRADNNADMLAKHRHRPFRREHHHGNARLSIADVLAIRAAPRGYGTGRALARHFGVCEATISVIRAGKSHSYIA
jgi:hypothetical protein